MKNTNKNNQNNHTPVLLEAVLQYLNPEPGESYLDLTAGYGGHAEAVISKTAAPEKAVLIDRDKNAVGHLQSMFAGTGAEIIHQDFLAASRQQHEASRQFDMILADLGVSSPHLNQPSRGFSFQTDGPLDMRMDQGQSLTAETIVNTYGEGELAEIIRNYGEEPKSRRIARMIVENRPLTGTLELAKVVAKAWPGRSRVHPATRTFQALRVAVNQELEQLESAISIWIDMLNPGGRIVVISFHSLEDRLVKQSFADVSGNRYDAILKILTRQPVSGDQSEIVFNPRARSAKLRAAVKIKNKKKGEYPYADSG